ncbi:hypothetical protein HY405_01570 [Candidatus Microgenomates bacterium]|nr:hypothetical protein [Candidatus Microgenomates bacterium]
MNKVSKAVLILASVVLHLSVLVVLWYFLQPISTWYLNKIPALGIDLYNSVTHVALQQRHFSFWFNGFKDIWFSGYPFVGDFPQFHYYAMIPFANLFGMVKGVQMYVVFSLFLLLVSSYLLFYKISKNIGLALVLAVSVLLSVNIYGAAVWGGSIPYFATQFFLPLVLLCGVLFFEYSSSRWLWLGSLFAGLAFLGHPLPTLAFIFPSIVILLIFYPQKNGVKKLITTKLSYVGKFFAGVIFTAFILLGDIVYDFVFNFATRIASVAHLGSAIGAVSERSPLTAPSETDIAIAAFYKNQIKILFSGTNELLFVLLISGLAVFIMMFIVFFVFKKEKRVFLEIIPFLVFALYVALHVTYNLTGHNFFPQGLYRAFWAFPVALGALVASLWRPLFVFPSKIVVILAIVGIILFGGLSYGVASDQQKSITDRIHHISDTSSAFPEVLSIKTSKTEQALLKDQLLPSFIDPNDQNQRLYASDATVNIWWNSFFNVPLARGYVDPPIGTDRRGSFFLLDIAIGNDTLVRDFKFPREMAKNYALFMIDWFGVRFFEGGHLSPAANAPPSSYLIEDEIFDQKEEVTVYGAIHRYETASGLPEARMDLPQSLVYYRVKEDYTSPIVYGSNAPVLLVISDDPGFEQIWRGLAASNLNSRVVVPIAGGKFIDDLNTQDFSYVDAVLLHNYSYHNQKKAFDYLSRFVKKGGKVFIDTGSEVKDATSDNLPDLFPMTASQRSGSGKEWNLEVAPDTLTEGVDFSQFGPPVFNNDAWKLSYPAGNLKSDAKVILSNHGKPILITRNYGAGSVQWSGMNLPYHLNQYNNLEEAKFFKNIIEQLVGTNQTVAVPLNVKWERPEKIIIQSSAKPRGVIVKEEFYNGWSVTSRDGNKNLKLYKAGPTFPGFIYVPLTNVSRASLELSFNGIAQSWIVSLVSLVSILLILETVLFNGVLVGRRMGNLSGKFAKKVSSWWEREEE